MPWGVVTGAEALGAYSGELTVHAWDLAVAIGVETNWPDSDIAVGLHMVQLAIPAEGRGDFMPFDDVVDPGPDAPAIARFVGWMGRNPADWT